MASITNNTKAHFCRTFFPTLKEFILEFNFNDNIHNLEMGFLLESYNYMINSSDPERKKKGERFKNQCRWKNTMNLKDEELMLAIEEYFEITDSSEILQTQRERLFNGLIEPDKFASDDDVIKAVFVDQNTLKQIFAHFGIAEQDIDSGEEYIQGLIKSYDIFAQKVFNNNSGDIDVLNVVYFNKALYLFQQCRNNDAHNIIIRDVPHRKIALQFLAYMYIGLTLILRKAWTIKSIMSTYTIADEYKSYKMPVTELHIDVTPRDSSSDYIYGYKLTPLTNDAVKKEEVNISPEKKLELIRDIRKYGKFSIAITYGTNDGGKQTKEFTDLELTYYYWQPTLEIKLPSSKILKPGLGDKSFDDLYIGLKEESHNIKDEKRKQDYQELIDKSFGKIEPELKLLREIINHKIDQQIALSENEIILKEKIVQDLKKEICQNATVDNKVLNNINELFKNVTSTIGTIDTTTKATYNFLQNWKLFMFNLSCIIPFAWIIYTVSDAYKDNIDFNIRWFSHQYEWLCGILIPILLSLGLALWTLRNIKTTSSWSKHWSWGCFVLSALLILGTYYFMVPYKDEAEFYANYDYNATNDEETDKKVCEMSELFRKKNPRHPLNKKIRENIKVYHAVWEENIEDYTKYLTMESESTTIKGNWYAGGTIPSEKLKPCYRVDLSLKDDGSFVWMEFIDAQPKISAWGKWLYSESEKFFYISFPNDSIKNDTVQRLIPFNSEEYEVDWSQNNIWRIKIPHPYDSRETIDLNFKRVRDNGYKHN